MYSVDVLGWIFFYYTKEAVFEIKYTSRIAITLAGHHGFESLSLPFRKKKICFVEVISMKTRNIHRIEHLSWKRARKMYDWYRRHCVIARLTSSYVLHGITIFRLWFRFPPSCSLKMITWIKHSSHHKTKQNLIKLPWQHSTTMSHCLESPIKTSVETALSENETSLEDYPTKWVCSNFQDRVFIEGR